MRGKGYSLKENSTGYKIGTSRPVAEVKDVDTTKRTIMGYASKFGNVDSDNEMVMPGAFTKTILENGPSAKNRIFHLWQHDRTQILGKPTVLKEDAYGLYFESTFPKNALSDYVLSMYQEKIINEHSIGYRVIKWEEEQKEGYYKLTELQLFEYSAVTWGANPDTPTVGVKSVKQVLEEVGNIKSLLKQGNLNHEEYFYLIEPYFNSIQSELKTLLDTEPEIKTTPIVQEPSNDDLERLFNSFSQHF